MQEWDTLINTLNLLEECRRNEDSAVLKINKFHQKILKSDKFSTKVATKLQEYYQAATVLTNLEQRLIADAQTHLKAYESALEDLKKKKRKPEDKISSGTNMKKNRIDEDGILAPGSNVVIKPAEDFILGTILGYNSDIKKYEVADVDDINNRHYVSSKQCLPLPSKSEKEFPENHAVLALYPNTTCFYKAVVVVPPSKNTMGHHAGSYLVRFDDDGDQNQPVTIYNCLEFPKLRK
ncbi:hypothetical protein HK100_003838 [Physocladia obscura]|uniref:SGF29 C-terminal domain-containing protein n=1 Tax=Physocladia obscura TaxID=109957 RepID=A0AAD5T917_9FUNG|nr:hypothetical protein HK100_003838 [Physocladia obscura]